jgi:hypothetical protein
MADEHTLERRRRCAAASSCWPHWFLFLLIPFFKKPAMARDGNPVDSVFTRQQPARRYLFAVTLKDQQVVL